MRYVMYVGGADSSLVIQIVQILYLKEYYGSRASLRKRKQ